jgi:hypothetical protein
MNRLFDLIVAADRLEKLGRRWLARLWPTGPRRPA